MQRGGRERETLEDAAAVKKSKALHSARCSGTGGFVVGHGNHWRSDRLRPCSSREATDGHVEGFPGALWVRR